MRWCGPAPRTIHMPCRRTFLLALLLWVEGCVPLSPPPLFAPHERVAADPEGTVSVGLSVGIGGEVFGSGWGVQVWVLGQITSQLAVGGSIGGGFGDPAGEEVKSG